MSGLLSDFGSKGGGPAFVTPKDMPRYISDPYIKTDLGTGVAASTGLGSAISTHGFGATASIVAPDTYVTVCDITGEGTLYYVVSTAYASTTIGTSVSLRVTVDGKVFEINHVTTIAPTAIQRIVLGPMTHAHFTASGEGFLDPNNNLDYGYNTNNKVNGGVQNVRNLAALIVPSMIDTLNLPRCKFETSLKVEAKGSVLGAGEQVKAHAIYLLRG